LLSWPSLAVSADASSPALERSELLEMHAQVAEEVAALLRTPAQLRLALRAAENAGLDGGDALVDAAPDLLDRLLDISVDEKADALRRAIASITLS
jgi:hypothetical protein